MSEKPFTDEEIQSIRKMLESEERVAWAWATARVWATWAAAVVTGTFAVWKAVEEFLKK